MITRQVFRLLTRNIPKYHCTSVRQHNFDGETYTKTSMAMITREDESHNYIQAYSSHGFRLTSGFHVLGPCAMFPRAVLHWNVPSADKITPESLSLFCMLEPKLDILLIGKGDWDAQVDKNIIRFLRSKKINVEILPTEQACSTFNFLNSERRVVAAGLIPPKNVSAPAEEDFSDNSFNLLDFEGIKEPGDLPHAEVEKTMKSFRDQGIMKTLAEREKNRPRSQGENFRQEERTEQEDKEQEDKEHRKK